MRLVITLTNLNVLITEADNAASRPQPDLQEMQDVNAARDQQMVYEGAINSVIYHQVMVASKRKKT